MNHYTNLILFSVPTTSQNAASSDCPAYPPDAAPQHFHCISQYSNPHTKHLTLLL